MCAAVAALVAVLGCSSTPPADRGATLSEAAKEAGKKAPEKKKVLETHPADGRGTPGAVAVVGTAGELVASEPVDSTALQTQSPPPNAPDDAMFVSIVGGGGTLNGEDFDGYGVFGIGFGGYFSERGRVDLSALYIPTQLSEGSGVVDALVNEKEFALDGRIRFRLTPPHTFMGLYALVGARVGWLMWDYHTPIIVMGDSGELRTLYDDRLTDYSGYIGAGIGLVQTRHLVVGAELAAGLKLYDGYTHEGFNQDLFDNPTEFLQLLFSVDYRL